MSEGKTARRRPGQRFQLFDGRRAIHVRRHHHDFFFSRSCRYFASLPTVVVLPAPCKPAISTMAGGFSEVELFVGLAHHLHQFFMDDFKKTWLGSGF